MLNAATVEESQPVRTESVGLPGDIDPLMMISGEQPVEVRQNDRIPRSRWQHGRMLPGRRVMHEEELRLRLVLRAGGFGTWVWDQASGVTWDAELEAVFGLSPGEFDGTYDAWRSMLHPEDREGVVKVVDEAIARRGTYEIRHRIVWPDGSVHWVEGLGQVTVDANGEPTGTIGCTRDVTRHVLIEQRLEESAKAAIQAAGRAELLQSVTAALARAMSVDEVAAALGMQIEGLLGAVGVGVALLSASGAALGVVHSFGLDRETERDFTNVPLTEHTPMTDCVRAGRPVIVTVEQLDSDYPELASLARSNGHTLLAALPLLVPGRALGALQLAFGGRSEISDLELDFVSAIAGQCSQAIDRARLVDRLGEVASTLQEGLAPQHLPDVTGFDVAAVYEPGGDETEHLGGDWYDMLRAADGTIVLGIGDVMGRGVSAATTMARVRTAARAYTWVDPTPEVVMRKMDAFVRREAPDDFITMVYAVLDPISGTMGLISAGHLPGVVLSSSDAPRLLRTAPGLPLGLAEGTRRTDSFSLLPDEMLLLFTDGLVERRDCDIELSLLTLLEAAGNTSTDGTLQGFLDRLVDRMVSEQAPGDDVTALMIRRGAAHQGAETGT